MHIIAGIALFLAPFLLAGMISSIVREDKHTFGPLPYCFGLGLLLVLIWIFG